MHPLKPKSLAPFFGEIERRHAKSCLEKIIKLAGNTRKLAILMEVAQPNIIRWKMEGVPPHHVVKLCRLSGDRFKPNDFRPDVFY